SAETDDPVTASSASPSYELLAAVIAGLLFCLVIFLLLILLFRRRAQKRGPLEDTVSTISDSRGSVASSLKISRPNLGYAVPVYLPPPPSISHSMIEASPRLTRASSDLALQYLRRNPRQSLSHDLDVISASMRLDDEEL
ncbi:hypothetical protein EGW08_008262, partial [Elysia chlorotica]